MEPLAALARGSSTPSFGPVMNPSSEIDISAVTFPMTASG
jgi:hypothetical protein